MNLGIPPRSAIFEQPIHRPQGAIRQPDGSVEWRLWAPKAGQVQLVLQRDERHDEHDMAAEPNGYFTFHAASVAEGDRYTYRLLERGQFPDPASRWQPDGVHAPSAVFFPDDYPWSDSGWTGVPREELVIYELHVGTFTLEGTFDAAVPRLEQLRELGVTAIEIMPVAQFPGGRNWGYDGVFLYAVQNSYGGPRGLQQLVDAAHGEGLAVFLDVVYNHFGPEGCYLSQFGPYFTDRYHTPWGGAVNYDGPDSDPVRRFVVENARMWVRDFHVDGLRLDAVHAIHDFSARHILAELQDGVQELAREQGRTVHVIAETNQNNVRLIDPVERNGFGLDGLWSDDFHHCVRVLLTGNREGYYRDFSRPEHLAKALEQVFVYDGQYSPFRRRRHGMLVGNRDRSRFVVCIHNHDQIGNRALGDRSAAYLPEPAQRLACGLLLISPCVPLLFMGEEYAERHPFPFFCSFGDEPLVEAVRRGRREEFAALEFQWDDEIPDPQAVTTFNSAKLAWQWPEGTFHARLRRLYADFLTARRTWPGLLDRERTKARVVKSSLGNAGGEESPTILVIERGGAQGVLICANLTNRRVPLYNVARLSESSSRNSESCTAKPLSAEDNPFSDKCLLSTEARKYGGIRDTTGWIDELLPLELVIWSMERAQ